jgi:hypothetical protein
MAAAFPAPPARARHDDTDCRERRHDNSAPRQRLIAAERLALSALADTRSSEHGVLVGRRNDGQPPWTFISGEIEPGESPNDASVREVKSHGTNIFVGDRDELAEVRLVSLAEAEQLMRPCSMFGPVREYFSKARS